MDEINVKDLKKALVAAGLEVFRVRGDEVHLAERQNIQLMEAGVKVLAGASPSVMITARAQRNDAPNLAADSLFDLVRDHTRTLVDHGYNEIATFTREIRSVSDSALLDVWFEVTLSRPVGSIDEAVREAQTAISTERYIVPVVIQRS